MLLFCAAYCGYHITTQRKFEELQPNLQSLEYFESHEITSDEYDIGNLLITIANTLYILYYCRQMASGEYTNMPVGIIMYKPSNNIATYSY